MGMTFLNSAFLFSAFAALLPLVIHLISRRRVATVDFSSLRFLKELERRKIRRIRLRQIALLIVRSLIILSVALSLARPTLTGAAARGAGRARSSIAIVLDNSASMIRSGEGGDLLSSARARAAELARIFDEGDQAFLVTASVPVASILPEGTFGREALTEAVSGVPASHASTDYDRAIEVASRLLEDSRNLHRELFIIGDMQETGWDRSASSAESGPESPGDVSVYVLPVSGPLGNLGVRSVQVERKYGGATGSFSVSAGISNFGRRGGEVEVKLFLDGRQAGQAGVTLDERGAATASFAVRVDESQWHRGWVELPPDALESDNRYYFVIPAERRAEILIVGPDSGSERDDWYYADMALDPTKEGTQFINSIVEAPDLARQDHDRFAVVVLADVGRLDAGAVEWIEQHMASGGGLLIIAGNMTDVRFWNSGFFRGLTGIDIVAPTDRSDGVRLAPAVRGHPLLEGLAFGERLIDDVTIRRAFVVDAHDSEVVLELPGVGPALVFGRSASGGELAVLATGLDPAWGDLTRSGLAVPLMHRLCGRLRRSGSGEGSAVVGDDLLVRLRSAPSGGVEVVCPDGSRVLADARSTGSPTAVVGSISHTGIYEFISDGGLVALGAVNVDPAESDLAVADESEMGDRVTAASVRVIGPGTHLVDEVVVARRGRELWRAFLYVALGLVALEMFIARPKYA